MKLYMKLSIGCGVGILFMISFGFIAFPRLIKHKVKKMITLAPETDIRGLFTKVPFPLEFRVYLFNVTNHMDVQKGELPHVQQIGPFCYEEWKDKVDVSDKEDEDAMFYKPRDTFIQKMWDGCLSGDETVIVPHPMILGLVNAVVRQKPAMLSLIGKAINSIYKNPDSIFLITEARKILFDGVNIDCGVKDFAGKAVCTQLKLEGAGLKILDGDVFQFSLVGPSNGTAGKVHKVLRGTKKSHDVGRIIEFDGKKELDVWPNKSCNQYQGTDGTIFPPYLTKEEGLASFSPSLCRSLVAFYVKKTKYDGIPVSEYTASLGDMSTNPNEKCYCFTPDTCLKKGLMDLYKCAGVPLYVSFPHFYDSHESYLKGVVGLEPKKENHSIIILFERNTGSPVYARKRLQFSMPVEPYEKIAIFSNLPRTVLPIFWVEEGVALNSTWTKPVKDLFKVFKIVKILTWLVIVGCLAGLAFAGYLYSSKRGQADITPVNKVQPADIKNGQTNGISTIMSTNTIANNEIGKY